MRSVFRPVGGEIQVIHIKNPLRDVQSVPPIAYCSRCFGEIYECDDVEVVGGCLVHETCLTDVELKECVLHKLAFHFASLF